MLEIDIVTPTRKLVEGIKATSVKLPAFKGEIEILPGHADLLTLLSTGVIDVVTEGKERRFAASYGFAEVKADKILVLAETCEESVDIDKERAKAARQKAEKALSAVLGEGEFERYQLKLQRAITRQTIARS